MSDENTSQDTNQDVTENSQETQTDAVTEEQKLADTLYDKESDTDQSDEKSESDETKEEKAEDESRTEDENKDDEKAEDEKSEDAQEDFTLEAPENSRLADADMERIAAYAKEQGLSKDAAEKLVQQESEARDSYFDGLQEQHKAMVEGWAEDVRNDKELGGENFAKSVELSRRVVERFGTEEFRKNLDTTGYGNHPEVLRTFARIGKAMENDQAVLPGANSSTGEVSMAEKFYGTNN